MKILVVYIKPVDKEEKETLKIVKVALKNHKATYSEKNHARKKHFMSKDLVITLGGDGTFLQTSHFILDRTPMFGVNANTRIKDGFYTICTKDNFEEKFKDYIKGKLKVRKLLRLEAKLDGKVLPEKALNEVYMGPHNAFITAVYHIITPYCDGRQKSSGVIVSTPTGSYAWNRSAGGKVMDLDEQSYEYLIREPHKGRLTTCEKNSGKMRLNQKIKIISEKNENVVVMDSLSKVYKFKEGSVLEIYPSKLRLNVVWYE
jgi:NAD+ kinase